MIPECLKKYDYRDNIIVDKDNPILIWKAWRDHYSGEGCHSGKAYLSSPNGEDALTWNIFRSLQMAGETGLEILSRTFSISKSKVKTILFWGCDVECHGEEQQLLNILIRTIDGKHRGTMTEPDLVIITEKEVVFVECKLNQSGKSSPWKASGEGWKKRYKTYMEKFSELEKICPESDRKELYQLIRQYVYAKSLSCCLEKKPLKPLVIPLVNEDYKCDLYSHYSKIKNWPESIKTVFKNFITWQDIDKAISESSLPDKERISAKTKCTLAHVKKDSSPCLKKSY